MRKSLGKRLRFEIFKRDGFVCQYCGDHPPSVILHVDHIVPVAAGGQNDMDNLVTSCQACNLGKGAVDLQKVPVPLKSKELLIREAEEQLSGYQEIIANKLLRIEEEADRIRSLYRRFVERPDLSEREMVSVKMFVEKIGFHAVYFAMEKALCSRQVIKSRRFSYFCGICWNIYRSLQK